MSANQAQAIRSSVGLECARLCQRRLTLLVLVLLAMPMLYGLSIGPAYRAEMRHGLPEETYNAIYGPILRLSDRYDPIHEFVHWYVELWV